MKKMLTFLIATILILAMSLMPLQAITGINSLVSYGEGNEIEGGCNGKNVDLGEGLSGLMVSNQSELVFIGNDDFKIKVGKPVKEFEIIDDVDNDGLKDVAVYIDSEDDYDDFKIVSSKTSKVLYATKYSYNTINDNNEAVNKNATIRQILFNDNIVYLIYNYHLVGISTKDYQVVFDYEAKDNIWKMALVNNQVIFTTQLGELGSLNKTNGKLNYTVALTTPKEIKDPRYDTSGKVNLNIWDIVYIKDKLYVTTEDAKLYQIDQMNGKIIKTVNLEEGIDEKLGNLLKNNNKWSGQLVPTGIHNISFMSYRMDLLDNNLMLISAYLGSPQIELNEGDSEKEIPHLILIDLEKMEVKLDIPVEQYNLDYSRAVKGIFDNQPALVVPTYASTGKLRLVAYSLNDGTVLKQTNLNLNGINSKNVKIHFANQGERYLLQVDGGVSLLVDQDLKTIEYLGSVKVVNKVVDLSDGTIVSVLNNGKITQIKKMGLGGRDDNLVTFNIPDGYHNNGFEAINYDEKHNHLLSLVSELNANGEVIASHIVIMNLNDGNTLADKKVLLEKGYDENNKYYEHYLIGETIRYFTDMNNDGKSEIIVDENILDGASLTFRSVYNKSFEGATTIIDVGDVNNDGISDLVNIGESEMRLYYSLKNGYDITYQKTNIAKSYDKKLQNNIHVKVLGDLDHDGIKDFVINAYNDKGCQCFQVIKGKDLSVRYSLLKDGVVYENEEDSFSVTGIDYDNDGVDDLVYGIYDEMRTVLSGATGEKLFEYLITDYHNDWDNSMGDPVPLENIVSFNLIENGNSVVKINDLNDDGIQELAYLVRDYDNSDYGTKNILKILNGSNYEELKSKILGKGNYDSSQITTVIGQSKLIYNDGTLSQIYDYRNDSLVAGLKMVVTSARTLNNQLLQLEDNVGQLYSFTDQRDFELVDFNEKDVNDGNLKISYKTEKNGLMYVYDQGNLIEKTTAKNFNVKLLAGEHDLIFSYNDGQGKVTHYATVITVEKSTISRYLIMLLVIGIVAGGFGLVFYPKYRLMKMAGVKHG